VSYLVDPAMANELKEYFGKDISDYAGKKPIEMLFEYDEWCKENSAPLTSPKRQQIFNALKICVYFANQPGRERKKIELMEKVPSLTPAIADILISAGFSTTDELESFVVPLCYSIKKFEDLKLDNLNGNDYSKADVNHMRDVWEKNRIEDIKDEAVRVYDKLLAEVDVGISEAPAVWLAILGILALNAQPEPPIGSNSRPPG